MGKQAEVERAEKEEGANKDPLSTGGEEYIIRPGLLRRRESINIATTRRKALGLKDHGNMQVHSG